MRKTFTLIAPVLAAAAILAAPTAAAETHLQCTNPSGNTTQCETPGNVQLNSSPSVTTSYPQYPYLYGGYGRGIDLGGLFGGGGHHGGGGHSGGGGGSHGSGGHH
jgi:hypothetical protein